jgi:glycosyltransferase involved in cell wall biosynthesis
MIRYSVIVPAYNAEKTLEACVGALVRQTMDSGSYEVIVVDDGSVDGTGEIARRFPVKYIRQENQGPAAARNHGAKEAGGEIILFTDADCVPAANWVEEMTKPFAAPDVVAVKGAYRTNQKSLVARFAQLEFEERFAILKKAGYTDMVDTYSAAFRREIFLRVGGFDDSFPTANNEDTEFSYRLSSMGYKMVFNPDAIVYHLDHPDSVRRYARLKFWRGYWRMVVYRRYPGKMIRDTYTPQNLKLQILLLFAILTLLPFAWLAPGLSLYALVFTFAFFLFSTLPFIRLAFKTSLKVTALAPLFLSLRAASVGLGALWGMASGWSRRR